MIILLTGSINSGKTTVSRELTTQLPNTAHVEVDALHEFIGFMRLGDAIPINLENAAAVTRNIVRRGLHVVLSYPLGQADHDYLMDAFADLSTPVHTFALSPDLAVALTDRGGRQLSDHERRRIQEQYADDRHRPPFGIRIDNTSHTPAETATAILAHIRASRAEQDNESR